MEMLGMLNPEYEVDHLWRTVLGLLYSQWCLRMDGFDFGVGRGTAGGLREDAGTVGEGIPDRGTESPQQLTHDLLELPVYNHVLVDAEVGVR